MKIQIKKVMVLSALFALFTLGVQAQTYGGFRAGINAATWQFGEEPEDDFSFKTGFVGGLLLEFGLLNILAIQPEINFIQKGYLAESDVLESKVRVNLNYLEVPLLAKLRLGSEAFRVNVMAGPSVGYGLSGQTNLEFTDTFGNQVDEDDDLDLDDPNINRIDLGLNLGASLNIGLGDGGFFFIDGRYGFGLSDFANDDPDESQIYNRGVQISAGILGRLSD